MPGSGLVPAPARTGGGPSAAIGLLRVGGVMLAALVLVGGTLNTVTSFFDQEQRVTTTLDTQVRRVVADTDLGSITVRLGAAGEPTRLVTTRSWSFHRPDLTSAVSNGTTGKELHLDASCRHSFVFGERCQVDVDLTVPPGTALDLSSSLGQISVTGADADLRVSTATGEVTLTGLSSSSVQAQAATGKITLSFTRPPTTVHARTSTGDVTVLVPPDGTAYHVQSSTSVGSNTVSVPTDPNGSRTIDVSSSIGAVTVATR